MDIKKDIQRIVTLGGKVHVKKDMQRYYLGNFNGNMSKERLFGKLGRGVLLFGMPRKEEQVVEAVESDTSKDLIKELQDKGMTREEAVLTISHLLKEGILVEEWDTDRGQKVLILRR